MSDAHTAGARVLYLSASQNSRIADALTGDAAAAAAFDATVSSDPIRLFVEVLSTKRVPEGSGVSYGHTFVTQHPTTLARVAIGYGHGLPRKAGNRASVTWSPVDGSPMRLPIVGRVAMDEFVVDAGDAPVSPGSRVCVFGDPGRHEVPLTEWAASIGESPVSIAACLDDRVERNVVR
ncbi:alanine racemase C-terminal domain-containing protein [Paramicrobacterium fandaimingii]|uniref:alanine racemase C-terminal domain-containing protein n=1 Tax=Paramicrobacterium fandaimingii TaxID=2708079 RepID=UPI00141F9A03|nr:alanine racemase C-terminal domain-containing protein [Microbacterium fandaimingii]